MIQQPIKLGRKRDNDAAAEPHVDPVCKMLVLPESAAATYEHNGTTYYFCMPGCRDKFAADPNKYLASGKKVSPPYEGGVDAEASGVGRRGGFSDNRRRAKKFDILINTTPLGMLGPNEDKTPLTARDLSGVRFVYDLVTRRDDTPLIREAKKAGVYTIGGVEMLIAQGIKQFEIWTGLEAPAEVMRRAVLDRLR